MGEKPVVSVTYENERISKKQLTSGLKCVLRLSCVVHGPIYGRFNAPINVKPAGEGGRAWGRDLTFFKNLSSNSLPTGKSFQSIATKFPHPGLHIAVYPKAGPKKGTIKISSNKTLQSLFINVTASPRIHYHVKAAIIRFNHSIRVLIHCIEYRNL